MDVSDEGLGVGLLIGLMLGTLGVARKGGFVVEAVKVATRILELLDPFFGLCFQRQLLSTNFNSRSQYLCNHHVAVECSAATVLCGLIDVLSNLGNNGGTESNVGNKVTVPIRPCY